jgi:hypothetical protein
MWSASELSDGGRGKGVKKKKKKKKKLTRLLSGSRNSSDRLPQGSAVGSPDEVPMAADPAPTAIRPRARDTDHRNMCCHSLEPDNASEDT